MTETKPMNRIMIYGPKEDGTCLSTVTSLLGTEIAKASAAAVLNSTTYVPSYFGP